MKARIYNYTVFIIHYGKINKTKKKSHLPVPTSPSKVKSFSDIAVEDNDNLYKRIHRQIASPILLPTCSYRMIVDYKMNLPERIGCAFALASDLPEDVI